MTFYEKLEYLYENMKEYDLVEELFVATGNPGVLLEMMVDEEQHGLDHDEKCYGDMIAWYLDARTAYDAVDWLDANGQDIESLIDVLIAKFGLSEYESPDGFSNYNEYAAWRNSG